MVKHQVHEAMPITDADALLAGLETEAVAKFEKKFLEVVEKLILEVGLAHDLSRFQPEKLEDVRVANRDRPLRCLGSSLRQ